MITRLLFWLALVLLVLLAARSKLKSEFKRPPAAGGARPDGPKAKVEAEAESMACCAHCGLHFPASESVRAGGQDYCCAAHVGLPPA